jgi:flagellar hook-associated protein 2
MGSIVTSGVGSGLDVAGLVTKLVQAEGQPKTVRLNQEEAKVQAKLSALGSLRSALAKFRDTVSVLKNIDQFQGRQVSLSTSDFLAATTDTTAVPGGYAIEVQQLASAQKLQSGPYGSASGTVGTGTLRIVTGGQTYDVAIDSSNDTLVGIANAINASAAGEKVLASVVSGASEARLTITARNSGAASAMTITQSGGDGGLAGLTYPPSGSGMTQLRAALDARVLVDGVLATSGTNSINGAIAGVTLNVQQQNASGETTTLNVDYDRAAARKTIGDFVDAYNSLIDSIKSVTSYDASTKRGAPLFGDSGVRNIADQLRRELTSNVAGLSQSMDMLAEIGITAQLDGKLVADNTRLDAAFKANFDAVGKLFATDQVGVAVKLDGLLELYLGASGVFDKRTESLNASIKDIGDRRTQLIDRLTALQARYTKQFNALDSLLSKLQGTSNYLTQQLGNLPGFK